MKKAIMTLILGVGVVVAVQADPLFTLLPPSGAVAGNPGSTVGWGFSLTNTTDYLLVTGAAFVPNPSPFGTFTDFISAVNFIVVGPGQTTVTQAFDPIAETGVGEFQIAKFVPQGTSINGHIVIDYSLFSQNPNDPNFDPNSLLVADAQLFAAASVRVVPEPSSLVLLAGAVSSLLAAVGVRRRITSSV